MTLLPFLARRDLEPWEKVESGEVSLSQTAQTPLGFYLLYREARLVGEGYQSLDSSRPPSTESKVLLALSKSSITELHLQSSFDFFILRQFPLVALEWP